MSRIACLRIPQYQIAVHHRHEPTLKGIPLILLAPRNQRSSPMRIIMCSEEARARQISAGMKLSEARAVCAELEWREYDQGLYFEVQKQMVRNLIACSPKVEALHDFGARLHRVGTSSAAASMKMGMFLLDASGLRYVGGESKFCRDILGLCSQCGFVNGNVGVADSAFAALVASRFQHGRWYVVPSGKDKEFLAPLSIKHLPVNSDIQESWLELGITTMGQLSELSSAAIKKRFGPEGVIALALVQGQDNRQPISPERERTFQCSMDIGAPVESLEETMFVMKSMLDRLSTELKQDGLRAEELKFSFYNDNDKFDERPVKLFQPSNNSRFLLEVIKLSLESQPLAREFTRLELAIVKYTGESWEQMPTGSGIAFDKYQSPETTHTSEPALLLLQRFLIRFGADAVVRPVACDQYLPDNSGVWMPVIQRADANSGLSPDTSHIKACLGSDGLVSGLVLKKCLMPVLVELAGPSPVAMTYKGHWYVIKEITAPERLSGLWWEETVRKSYYMALIEPAPVNLSKIPQEKASSIGKGDGIRHLRGDRLRHYQWALSQNDNDNACAEDRTGKNMLVLLVYDHERRGWTIEGVYD